ncbi:kinase-like domain-containing protein [Russula dissimulans]|nr:kinase-like domain-containing protein [Russula dissimulans]
MARYLATHCSRSRQGQQFITKKRISVERPGWPGQICTRIVHFSHMLEREGETKDVNVKLTEFKAKINQHDAKHPMKSFFTKDDQGTNNNNANNNNGAKKRRLDEGVGDGSGEGRAGGVNAADCADLRAHGYEVKPEAEDIVDPSGKFVLQAFKIQMPSHILPVYQPSVPGKEFTAKKVHEESNELLILKLLNVFQPQQEHIISLHDSFQTELTSWAIFPKLDSVADYVVFSLSKLYQNVAQVCWGLIRGVAFLHKLCIAHRDIKPDNLLVDREFCLKIIDFDIAMQVKDEDEEVDGQCGTKHWIAPEIEEKLMYSPIKADRWSTGRVLQYLLEKSRKGEESLMTIARKLMAYHPKQRPSMLEIAAPLLDVDNVVSERKASRSRQDSDGKNAGFPAVKKQKVSDNNVRVTIAELHGSDTSTYGSRSLTH